MMMSDLVGGRAVSSLLCCASSFLAVAPAVGQPVAADQARLTATEGAPEPVSDIVVTATRRSERVSRVPLNIAASAQAKLDSQGVKDIADLARLTPSLQFVVNTGVTGGSSSQIAIRGIFSNVGASTTGVYIDDTPIQVRNVLNTSGNAYPSIFDLDRVEVLRSPQGTLFGAGAEGGAIRFITVAPDLNKASGRARSELAFTESGSPSYEAGVAYGLPLVADRLAIRASAWYRRDGGYIDRLGTDGTTVIERNSNRIDTYAIRGTVGFALSDRLMITPSIFYQNMRADDRSQYWENISDPSNRKFRNGNAFRQPTLDKFLLSSLKIQYDISDISLILDTSYFYRRHRSRYDYSNFNSVIFFGSPYPPPGARPDATDNANMQHNFTQEVRIQSTESQPFNWVVGGFYGRNKQRAIQLSSGIGVDDALAPLGLSQEIIFGVPLVDGVYEFADDFAARDGQLAGFGEVSYEILNGLRLIAGVRLSRTRFSFIDHIGGPVNGGSTMARGVQREIPITPKFGISYQLDPDNFIYATSSKGFRIGGAQGPVSFLCKPDLAGLGYTSAPTQYQSDSVWSYEAGSKNSLLDGNIRLDVSVYYLKWRDIQHRIYLTNCGYSFVGNVGSATGRGIDFQSSFKPFNTLTLNAAISLNYIAFDKTISGSNGSIIARKGDSIGRIPLSILLSGQYELPLAEDRKPYVRADYQYRSRGRRPDPQSFGYDANIPRTPATHFVSLRAGITTPGWDISAFVDNLLNTHDGFERSHDTKTSPLYYNITFRPRTAGLTAVARF